ncbi:MAG: S8 family serine peptidase [Alphaproteobacteria bacterium]|nr:S8 family serine peptidase [Alphaproteobacteria bacterium]
MWALLGIALAAPPPAGQPLNASGNPVLRGDLAQRVADGAPTGEVQVVAELAPGADVGPLLAAAPGATVEAVAAPWVQLRLPWSELGKAAAAPGVRLIRRPYRPHPQEVTSQGVAEVLDQDWHAAGFTGAGVRVAILDVGFDGYEDLLGTELPDAVNADLRATWRSSEHGTDVAEIVHDMAPDAALDLYSFDTDVEFMVALMRIADSDAAVVNASIGFDNVWHADGTSPWTEAVDRLVDGGTAWMSAAGNEVGNYHIGAVTDTDGDGWLEIEGLEDFPIYGDEGEVEVSIRWSEPFAGASTDLDLFVQDSNGTRCGTSRGFQNGDDDPYEHVDCELDDGGDAATLSIELYSGTPEGLTVWIYADEGLPDAYATRPGTLTLPADGHNVVSVAAWDWEDNRLMDYSSRGPTDDGRLKPDLAAPSYVRTATSPSGFGGTSAATPHVTGAAALVLQAGLASDPGALADWLRAHTEDRSDPGPDNLFGYGILRLGEPPSSAPDDTDDPDDTDVTEDSDPTPAAPHVEPRSSVWACGAAPAGPWWLALFALGLLRRSSSSRA